MHTTEGLIREKLGRTVNKVMLLRNVGIDAEGVPKYRVVAQKFFRGTERFWMFQGDAYELKLENEAYGRGETHVQFLDYDTGDSINMTGLVKAASNPKLLGRAVEVEHIKVFVRQNKAAVAWVFLIIGIAVGVAIGFSIGQNIGAIASAVNGGGVPGA
jgi:hypothetical protein